MQLDKKIPPRLRWLLNSDVVSAVWFLMIAIFVALGAREVIRVMP